MVVVCGAEAELAPLATAPLTLAGLQPLAEHAGGADILVVPTWPVGERPVPSELATHLRSAHDRGARVIGLCLGAFALAEAGLLDGRSAVTHWRYADELPRRFPLVRVERDPLYLDLGTIVTSAGSWTAACTWCAATTGWVPPGSSRARW